MPRGVVGCFAHDAGGVDALGCDGAAHLSVDDGGCGTQPACTSTHSRLTVCCPALRNSQGRREGGQGLARSDGCWYDGLQEGAGGGGGQR